MDIIKNIVAFIFVLGTLVIVHELGHFVMAKVNKMHVYQFCIGLGPKLLKYKGKETTYSICVLPIGGMVDLREDENDPENLRSFAAKKPWQRLVVILAGAIMNFILAFIIIIAIYFSVGVPSDSNELGEVPIGNPAYEAGLRTGDKLVEVNGISINKWLDITNNVVLSGESKFEIVYNHEGSDYTTYVEGVEGTDGYYRIGIGPTYEKDFVESLKLGSKDFVDKTQMIGDFLVQLATGKQDPKEVSGPVGIYRMVGEVAETNDIRNLLYFTAILSINLGIFNLLPIPFLDGGRALFILYEIIFRKPIDKDKEAFAHFIGMVALFSLMILLVVKDLRM